MEDFDSRYMRRALELARHGLGNTSPNPMVGAVIVHSGRIIGEGYHRRCGEGHAEVNAIASVAPADRHLLPLSTIYVTLEPCSHYGKTPPCSRLIIDNRIPRVVIGTVDPYEKVAGRGVTMLRDAGIEVTTGVLEDECRELNRRFFTAHTLRRPFVTLKWAQSADGFLDHKRDAVVNAYRFSTALTSLFTARLRSLHDAIMTSATTVNADNPRLTVRGWAGRQPIPVVLDRSGSVDRDATLFHNPATVILPSPTVNDALASLYRRGITSVLVEAGPRLLGAFLSSGLWDEARVEVAPAVLGDNGCAKAPEIASAPLRAERLGQNTFYFYRNY